MRQTFNDPTPDSSAAESHEQPTSGFIRTSGSNVTKSPKILPDSQRLASVDGADEVSLEESETPLNSRMALGELYLKVKPEVARVVHSLLAAAPPDELTHDACVAVVFSIDRFRYECAFSTWLYAVVARHVRKWIRSEQRNRELLRAASTTMPTISPGLPDDAAFARLRMGRLKRAIHRLSVRQRLCLELIYFEAHTVQMAAQRLGISPEAVRMTIYRARSELRALLLEE